MCSRLCLIQRLICISIYGGRKFPNKVINPFESEYDPLMDSSADLGPFFLNYFQTQIGVLRWMVELGRIDIITEVFMLASQLAIPMEGHLEEMFRISGYLKGYHNAWMVFDPTYPTPDMSMFQEHDWCGFYGDVKEALPTNAPEQRDKEIDMRIFVDSDHAGDKLTRQSITGYIIFLNNAPIAWLYKKQETIETSVFGADFFCDEYWNGNTPGIAIQAVHDGSANLGTIVDLWGQYVSYSKHTAVRVHIEDKVKLKNLP